MDEVSGILAQMGQENQYLIMHLNGILKPKVGEVIVNDVEVNKKPREARKIVWIVFQDSNDQLFSPKVFDDVAFSPYNLGLCGRELEERVVKALRLVGMKEYILGFGEKRE